MVTKSEAETAIREFVVLPRVRLRSHSRVALWVAVLAFVVYAPGLWWGAPYATAADRAQSWGTDDQTPLGPLAQIHNLIQPKPDRYVGYPLAYSFIVAAAYTPYLAYLGLSGKLTAISAVYPFGLSDPVGTLIGLTYIAHMVTVLMGVGIVVAAYDTGRVLWGMRAGILAALFAMLPLPMFYYTRTGNVDVPALFFTALAVSVFVRIMINGYTLSRAVWVGILVGLAIGTKETSFPTFLAFPLVLLWINPRERSARAGANVWGLWKLPLISLGTALLVFGVSSGLLIDPAFYRAHVQYLSQFRIDVVTGNVAYLNGAYYPYTWLGHIQLAERIVGHVVDAVGVPGLALGIIGIAVALRRERRSAVLLMLALTYVAVLFWNSRSAQMRYIMPVAYILAIYAARATAIIFEARSWPIRAALSVLAASAIGISLLRGIDLTGAMVMDSRYAAAEWLSMRTESGDLIESFGPSSKLPPLPYGISTDTPILFPGGRPQPRLDAAAVQDILRGWDERKPKFIVIIPDYTSPPGAAYSGTCPPLIYEGLLSGTLGYELAAYFETPSLFPWVQRPPLDYPTVNPPIRVFARVAGTPSARSTP